MDRASFDRAVLRTEGPYRILDRFTGAEVEVSEDELTDLCRVHLYDWLEQAPRSHMPDYRREEYRRLATRLGGQALESYDRVFATEVAADGN
jgi:hypothetical protein